MKQKYIDFFKQTEESNEHWTEIAISDFTDEVCRLMDEERVSRAELANKIDSSPAYITKVLRGNVNFTLATMTKLARALGTVVRIHLAHKDAVVYWEDEQVTTDTESNIFFEFEERVDNGIRFVTIENPHFYTNSDNDLPRVVNG